LTRGLYLVVGHREVFIDRNQDEFSGKQHRNIVFGTFLA